METFAAAIWDLLAAPGRTFALTFIVLIVVGINALTLLFFGSAIVALERFARAITSWRTAGVAWLAFSAVVRSREFETQRTTQAFGALSIGARL